MTTALIEMLTRARRAGLVLALRAGGQLVIRGPRSCEPLVQALLARKADVITVLAVYNGHVPRLDWRREPILDHLQPCVLCRRPTLLIEPYDGRPCHKSCAEASIRWGTLPGKQADGGHAA